MFGRAKIDEDRNARGLAAFTFLLVVLAVSGLIIDTLVRANTMQADPKGYPVRLVIPEPFDTIAKRPPPVVLGENVELVSAALAEADTSRAPTSPANGTATEPGAFERAFAASQGSSLHGSEGRPSPKSMKSGMLKVDFDLQGGPDAARTISVEKAVTLGGNKKGKLAIRVDGAAQIFANRGQLVSLLEAGEPGKAAAIRSASSDEYVSFRQLRDLGVDIRYDPSADRIVLPTAS